ncbi:DNA repair protein complementing XP-C cells homolog isoform X2 [Hydractinia symbiolongicarpus]|uniref:DNA repair protein complementing XP-C cells homolog isoform X2 n=1 Tax=Hydractinia symbiolongicarpus TaxID=13093 RepID=UPI00254FD27F|nr:DNA repair protein complementing XP-C cells homolog isoform X2 [Hydractinia symbiolongicarpus]
MGKNKTDKVKQEDCSVRKRRSTRSLINYAEENENCGNSDSDFEPNKTHINQTSIIDDESSHVDQSRGKRKRKQKKKPNDSNVAFAKDESDEEVVLKSFIGRPNLSEDESSDSDDDTPISKLCKVSSENGAKVKMLEQDDVRKISHDDVRVNGLSNEQSIQLTDENKILIKENDCEIKKENVVVDPTVLKSLKGRSSKLRKRDRRSNVIWDQPDRKPDVDHINNTNTCIKEKDGVSSNESSDNWEEVDEAVIKLSPKRKKIKKKEKEEEKKEEKMEIKDLQISVGVKSIHKKRRTREEKLFIWLRQLVGRFQRERQILLHKCHLLSLLAKALKENKLCSNKICMEASKMKYLKRIHIFVTLLRAIGFLARLVISLQPCAAKIKQGSVSSPDTLESTETTSKKTHASVSSPYFADKNNKNSQAISSKPKGNKKVALKKKVSKIEENPTKNKSSQSKHKTEVSTEEKKEYGKRLRKKTSNYAVPEQSNNSDDDKEEDKIFDSSKTPRKIRIPNKSTPSSSKKKNSGIDEWIEVYLPTMQKWISVELVSESINQPEKIEAVATSPLKYVVAIDNDHRVKDVTCRYAIKWLSYNRKLRVDREWWAKSLEAYKPPDNTLNSTEDAQLKKHLLQQDFPKTISEFKDNPLYALSRHLLKFEAIYPESAVPLGYIRNEAIYSRDCVHQLHTRETWMKEARVVKAGEQAYKIVKGRPKRNTPLHERDNVKVEVFGLWQTEPYVPPPVKDGKVPKNEYGNVELFKPSMLPAGAVHLPMSNMQKIARKLNVDYAPAMMGWDFHGGFCHPVIEGVVVAKEFEDKLLDAWRRDEEESRQKEKEKREKAVYERWKRLIKGLLILHKLKNKYNFELDEEEQKPKNPKTQKKEKRITKPRKRKTEQKGSKDEYSDLSVSWPMNRQSGTTSLNTEGHVHVFLEANHTRDPVDNSLIKVCSCGLKLPLDTEEAL